MGLLRFHTAHVGPASSQLGQGEAEVAGFQTVIPVTWQAFFGFCALLHGFSLGWGGGSPTSAFSCDGPLGTFCSRHIRE